MKKIKTIFITLIAIVLTGVFIAVMSYIIESATQSAPIAPLEFGDYSVMNVNGEIDQEDGENTIYDNINQKLLFNDIPVLKDLKVVDLYSISLDDSYSGTPPTEEIVLEIPENYMINDSFTLLKIDSSKNIEIIQFEFEERTRDSNETYNVITFTTADEGYFGYAISPGVATQTTMLFAVSIISVIALYLLFFVIIKSKRDELAPI